MASVLRLATMALVFTLAAAAGRPVDLDDSRSLGPAIDDKIMGLTSVSDLAPPTGDGNDSGMAPLGDDDLVDIFKNAPDTDFFQKEGSSNHPFVFGGVNARIIPFIDSTGGSGAPVPKALESLYNDLLSFPVAPSSGPSGESVPPSEDDFASMFGAAASSPSTSASASAPSSSASASAAPSSSASASTPSTSADESGYKAPPADGPEIDDRSLRPGGDADIDTAGLGPIAQSPEDQSSASATLATSVAVVVAAIAFAVFA